jgi:hypothetical protein
MHAVYRVWNPKLCFEELAELCLIGQVSLPRLDLSAGGDTGLYYVREDQPDGVSSIFEQRFG